VSLCTEFYRCVAKISQFVHQWGGNIVHADHHLDEGLFLSRLEWELVGFQLSPAATRREFAPLAQAIHAQWSYHTRDERPKVAVFVGKQSHFACGICSGDTGRENYREKLRSL